MCVYGCRLCLFYDPGLVIQQVWHRARTHGQKSTQICDLLANKCPLSHDSVSKTWKVYLTRGHLFDSEGHLFEMVGRLFDREGHSFDRKGHLF